MGNFKYKTASTASWLDVPMYAYYGTFAGTLDVVYPPTNELSVVGQSCSMVNTPYIYMQSQAMPAMGMDFWMNKFSSSTSNDVEFWLTAYNSRDASWRYYTGWLQRPTCERIQIGSFKSGSDNNIIHYDFKIKLLQAASAAS